MNQDWSPLPEPEPPPPVVRARGWRAKFAEAIRGVSLGIHGQASFFVHFFFATFAIAAAILLECDRIDWCLVVFCIGMVVTAELFNSSLETLFHGLDSETKQRLVGVLDIAAGAVLTASGTAVVVGCLVFIPRLLAFMGVVEQ